MTTSDKMLTDGATKQRNIDDAPLITRKIRALQSNINDIFNIVSFGALIIDETGICESVNNTLLAWLDRTNEEVVGKIAFQDWLTPESHEKFIGDKDRVTVFNLNNVELSIINKKGVVRKTLISAFPLGSVNGDKKHYRFILVDITEKLHELERHRVESLAFNSTNKKLSSRSDKNYIAEIVASLEKNKKWEGEVNDYRKDGELFTGWLTIQPLQDSDDKTIYYVASLYDLTESKKLQRKLTWLAEFDSLTHLANRRKLSERLRREISISRRSGLFGAVFFIDLDNFKAINDAKGHAAGDKLLIETSHRLSQSLRAEDMVSRLGGDEFVILITDLSSDEKRAAYQAKMNAEKLLGVLSKSYEIDDFDFRCTASIGIAMFGGNDQVDDLIHNADLAMYQAKKLGRNRLQFFNQQMQDATVSQIILEQDLRRAIIEHELDLYFQPQFDENFRVFSAEVLLRWRHPDRGLMIAEDFIPLAEETGLILQIGALVIQRACEQLLKWEKDPDAGNISLSINISARQFIEPKFDEFVLAVLKKTHVNPAKLLFELTETIVHNIFDTKNKMINIGATGVRFSLDDFGTGYSSLSVLTELPIWQLKIDKSFIKNLFIKKSSQIVTETIIGMSESLALNVIAEGVETHEQLQFLRAKGCSNFQGNLLGAPMPIDRFEKFLREQNNAQ
ncbi:MAG: EAL domain-containing protein [Methylocystaceae bacterium]|nr:EAL domain-containing protein [Methylocystaceae bacterium]